jgi:AmmeMemoRadiSam system protein A
MAPSDCIDLSDTERKFLLQLARQSLHTGLQRGEPAAVVLDGLAKTLTTPRGVFVTLTQQGRLRGCIGSMEASEPLAHSVAESAYSAAFKDPRFPQLQSQELDTTQVEISVLSPLERMSVQSRSDLLSSLRPTLDGLFIQDRHYRSTFLPKVWEQLPDPDTFLDQLLTKASLPTNHWSATLQCFRYHTVTFGEQSKVLND